MRLFCQRNYPGKLGFGPTIIADYGCKLTCFSIITGIEPVLLNEQFKKDGAFTNDLLIDSRIAPSLGIEFFGVKAENPKRVCLAEVDMSPRGGKQQHFVVWMNDGTIADPWTGTIRPADTYPILNYRAFNFDKYTNDMKPTKKLAEAYHDIVGKDCGDNMNEKEQDNFAEKIQTLLNQPAVIKEVIKEVPVEVIKEVEKLVEIPATDEQVKAATRSYVQKFLDLLFK